jgi:CRP-like cAMP-binding protein
VSENRPEGGKGGSMIPIKDLKEADLFKKLNSKQLQQLGKHFMEESYEAGEVIFTQGELARNLYILLEGEVALGIKAKSEIDITAYSAGKKGETFGLPCLNKPYRNSVSAICNKRTRVLSIEGETLRKLMWQNSKLGIEVMEKVAEVYLTRLNSTRAMIINLFKMFKFQTGKSKLMETYYET